MTVLLQKNGIKSPSGYGNNDETLFGSVFIGTPCSCFILYVLLSAGAHCLLAVIHFWLTSLGVCSQQPSDCLIWNLFTAQSV